MAPSNFKLRTFFSGSKLWLVIAFTAFYAFNILGVKEQKTVSVSADKMNVFYIGVDNPLTVAVEGIPDEKVTLASDELQLTKTGRGKYNVVAKTPGTATILVHGEGFEPQTLTFRVKRIPDPVATLENPNLRFKTEGTVTAEEFKETVGVILEMGNCFDFDSKLKVMEYSIVRVSTNEDPVEVICRDSKLNEKAKKLIEAAKPGDRYYFEMIQIKTEGDAAARKLNSLVFKIK